MSVESWIDEIAALAGTIDNGKGKKVRSYSVFKKAEFPESLTEFPCAITYPVSVTCHISESGSWEIWQGSTEFHLSAGVSKKTFPELLRFYAKIRNAFALHRTLGGKVGYCSLAEEPSIQGPLVMQYGTENPHLGMIARWVVKENISGDFTLGT